MRRSLLLAPLALALSLAACHKGGGAEAAAAPAPSGPRMPAGVTPALIATGDSIFHSGGCQRCHGQKGVGGQNGPSLVAGPWLHSTGKYEEIVQTITTGVPRTALKDQNRRFPMNGRGGQMNLNDDQVKAVAAYVWSISRDKH
ncbi:MAG: c-type cytochrome [Gemmatimonadaceae bacterium]|nr:c-type cytochrome [Gemmatimonadaceae bacterium]